MRHLLTLTLFLLLLTPTTAVACADPHEPPFSHELARAKSVFILRLVSLRLADHTPGSRSIIGDVELIRSISGASSFRQIAFTDVPCGGMRVRVGRYYAAATRQDGSILHLVPGDNSVIDVSSDYARSYPPPKEQSKWQWHIANYVQGIPLPAEFLRAEAFMSAHSTPPAPPPPPPPSETE